MLKNKALTYTLAVYAVSAVYSILFLLFPIGDKTSYAGFAITSIYMFIPIICSAVLSKLVYKEPFRESIGLKFAWNNWYIFAIVAPLALAFLSFGFALLLPGVSLAPDMSGMLGKFREMLTPEQFDQAIKQSDNMKAMFKTDYYYLIVGALNAVVSDAR